MVEINNQRKAFLDMLAWSEGTDNGRRRPEIMVMTSLWAGEPLLITPIASQTCHAKPEKLKSAPDATSFFPVGGMPTASNGLKDFSKSLGRCGIAAD